MNAYCFLQQTSQEFLVSDTVGITHKKDSLIGRKIHKNDLFKYGESECNQLRNGVSHLLQQMIELNSSPNEVNGILPVISPDKDLEGVNCSAEGAATRSPLDAVPVRTQENKASVIGNVFPPSSGISASRNMKVDTKFKVRNSDKHDVTSKMARKGMFIDVNRPMDFILYIVFSKVFLTNKTFSCRSLILYYI